jgi:hypothetical protein
LSLAEGGPVHTRFLAAPHGLHIAPQCALLFVCMRLAISPSRPRGIHDSWLDDVDLQNLDPLIYPTESSATQPVEDALHTQSANHINRNAASLIVIFQAP